jgi:psp operon transcriptional activator
LLRLADQPLPCGLARPAVIRGDPARRFALRQRDSAVAEHFAGAWRSSWIGPLAGLRAAQAELEAYSWPGNVRELRNVIERAVYRAEGSERKSTIQLDPFVARVLSPDPAGAAEVAAYAAQPLVAPAEPVAPPASADDLAAQSTHTRSHC